MAVSNDKMEALTVVEWRMVVWRSERERRESVCVYVCVCVFDGMRKKKKRVHILTNYLFFTDGFSISNVENEQTMAIIPNFQIPTD